jgi:uncharacterized membrane protein (DUF2068 family)
MRPARAAFRTAAVSSRFGYRPRMHSRHAETPRTLALIAAFKFFKSTLLVVLAIALLHLRNPDTFAHVTGWIGSLPIVTGHHFVTRAFDDLLGVSPHTFGIFSAVAATYATLYAIEGYGLWRGLRWAEYLTVISTSLFIPLELWECLRHFTPMKLAGLVINVAIVAYLVYLLRMQLEAERKPQPVRT